MAVSLYFTKNATFPSKMLHFFILHVVYRPAFLILNPIFSILATFFMMKKRFLLYFGASKRFIFMNFGEKMQHFTRDCCSLHRRMESHQKKCMEVEKDA